MVNLLVGLLEESLRQSPFPLKLIFKLVSLNVSQFLCRQVLLEAARKAGVEGAEEFLKDPNQGLNKVSLSLSLSLSSIYQFIIPLYINMYLSLFLSVYNLSLLPTFIKSSVYHLYININISTAMFLLSQSINLSTYHLSI